MSHGLFRSPTRISTIALALAAALLVGGVIPLHRRATAKEGAQVEERVLLLPPPLALRVASLGHSNMMADLVWLLTIQYIGGHISTDRRVPELRRLVETVVALDPAFVEAYTLGALFLNYTGGDRNSALALLERGARANPTRWELPHDLARTYYLDLQEYAKALHWFQVTDRLPGRPEYVPRFIARLYAATGQRETALELWQAMRDSATSDWVREIAEQEVAKLLKASPVTRQPGEPRDDGTPGAPRPQP